MYSMIDSLHTAYSDVMKFLGITNCYLQYSDYPETVIIKPLIIDTAFWIVMAKSNFPEDGLLIVKTDSRIYSIKIRTEIYFFADDEVPYLKLNLKESLPPELQEKILQYVVIRRHSEKRSEERYEVGLSNWKFFGLEKPEQLLYVNQNISVKCILNNVSVHGALVTGQAASVKVGENISKLYCRFICPINTLSQSAIVVRVEKKTEQLYRYSLQFIDPVALIWQSRLDSYVRYLNESFKMV